jgi:hypothetical protein
MTRAMVILKAYELVVLDEATVANLKALIASGNANRTKSLKNTRWQAFYLREELRSHSSEDIAAAERQRQRITFIKSLFGCGTSAQQVTPQNN